VNINQIIFFTKNVEKDAKSKDMILTDFSIKIYVSRTHSKNEIPIYYYKEYYIRMYEHNSFIITNKR
jgi:hypothetical protein